MDMTIASKIIIKVGENITFRLQWKKPTSTLTKVVPNFSTKN